MGLGSISIGCASAWAGHRLDAGVKLADSGEVDYLAFDCLAERTLALAQLRKDADPSTGYDQQLDAICSRFSPFLKRGGIAVGNFGGTNPDAALARATEIFRQNDLGKLRIGVIRGDDVLAQIRDQNVELPELGCRVNDLDDVVISAHAYIGADPIVDLLGRGATFIFGGRIADPSLYVGPIAHVLGHPLDDWNRMAHALLAGHLLECGEHVTGANFADPPYRHVPNLHDLGAPIADVTDSYVEIRKLPGTGGLLNNMTVRAQLAYELHDPAAYLTPDVTADFTNVEVEDVGPDRVRVHGAVARGRPDSLKVLVGVDYGWKVICEMSYGGPGCVERAMLAEDVIRKRIETYGDGVVDINVSMHGYNALRPADANVPPPRDVRLRIATRCSSNDVARLVVQECENTTYFGPAGGGGFASSINKFIGVTPAFVPREQVRCETEIVDL